MAAGNFASLVPLKRITETGNALDDARVLPVVVDGIVAQGDTSYAAANCPSDSRLPFD